MSVLCNLFFTIVALPSLFSAVQKVTFFYECSLFIMCLLSCNCIALLLLAGPCSVYYFYYGGPAIPFQWTSRGYIIMIVALFSAVQNVTFVWLLPFVYNTSIVLTCMVLYLQDPNLVICCFLCTCTLYIHFDYIVVYLLMLLYIVVARVEGGWADLPRPHNVCPALWAEYTVPPSTNCPLCIDLRHGLI